VTGLVMVCLSQNMQIILPCIMRYVV